MDLSITMFYSVEAQQKSPLRSTTPRLWRRLQRHQFPKSSRASRVLSLYVHRSSGLHLACESNERPPVNLLARFPADRVAVQELYNIHAVHQRYRDHVLDVALRSDRYKTVSSVQCLPLLRRRAGRSSES